MVKIRLARQGRKKLPIYKIVATDSRSRRDGRFIENLGQYRPSNEVGQKVKIDAERTLYWLGVGAQPTDTVRSLLSGEGILLRWHLDKKKIDPARASEILTTWKGQREAKLATIVDAKQQARDEVKRKAAVKKAAELAQAQAAAVESAAAAEAASTPEVVAESAPIEAVAEAPAEAPQAIEAPAAQADATPATEGEPARSAEGIEG